VQVQSLKRLLLRLRAEQDSAALAAATPARASAAQLIDQGSMHSRTFSAAAARPQLSAFSSPAQPARLAAGDVHAAGAVAAEQAAEPFGMSLFYLQSDRARLQKELDGLRGRLEAVQLERDSLAGQACPALVQLYRSVVRPFRDTPDSLTRCDVLLAAQVGGSSTAMQRVTAAFDALQHKVDSLERRTAATATSHAVS
jgi:hypothetical protein